VILALHNQGLAFPAPLPLPISFSSCRRSSPLNLTTHFFTEHAFTEIPFAAMIASIANSDESESQNNCLARGGHGTRQEIIPRLDRQ
jgi:hypothetical protein